MSCFIEMLLLSCTSLFHQDSAAGEFYEASPIYSVDVQTLQRRLLLEELRQLELALVDILRQ